MSTDTATAPRRAPVLGGLCLASGLLTIFFYPICIGHVAPSGYSFSIGGGYIEYGYDWGWIRQKMLPGPSAPPMGWSVRPLYWYDRTYADVCIPIWIFNVLALEAYLVLGRPDLVRRFLRLPHRRVQLGSLLLIATSAKIVDVLVSGGLLVWLLAPLAITFPTWRSSNSRAQRRMRRGLCPTCEYNLFGNESGTCPECGMKLSSAFREELARRGSPAGL